MDLRVAYQLLYAGRALIVLLRLVYVVVILELRGVVVVGAHGHSVGMLIQVE